MPNRPTSELPSRISVLPPSGVCSTPNAPPVDDHEKELLGPEAVEKKPIFQVPWVGSRPRYLVIVPVPSRMMFPPAVVVWVTVCTVNS